MTRRREDGIEMDDDGRWFWLIGNDSPILLSGIKMTCSPQRGFAGAGPTQYSLACLYRLNLSWLLRRICRRALSTARQISGPNPDRRRPTIGRSRRTPTNGRHRDRQRPTSGRRRGYWKRKPIRAVGVRSTSSAKETPGWSSRRPNSSVTSAARALWLTQLSPEGTRVSALPPHHHNHHSSTAYDWITYTLIT